MSQFENFFKGVNEYKDKELTLSRINNALTALSFDEKKLGKIIHIAGSNGKGSTSYFVSQLLQSEGYNTALFTSPHILKINERIKINDVEITDKDFDRYFQKNISIVNDFSLTYFEAIFLIAIDYFINNSIDYTILETGLGGRFDATNTVEIKNKISVITKIAQDHIDVFGKNIFDILTEKLGIVRENSDVFIGINSHEIIERSRAKLSTNIIHLTSKNSFADKSYPYPYNENYSLAKNVVEFILKKRVDDKILQLPLGRYETHNKIIFDSSHNISGLLALKKSNIINEIDTIIFTQTRERNIYKFISILKTITDKIILTSIPNSTRSIDVNDINDNSIMKFQDPLSAYNYAKIIAKKKILIVGSFYLLSYLKTVVKADEL